MPVDASCYSINVRCDNRCLASGQFAGRDEKDCFRQGQERGWKFKKKSRPLGAVGVICPRCARRGHGRDWNE